MAPYVHRVFSEEEYGIILEHYQYKVKRLYAIHGFTESFLKEVRRMSEYFSDVPGHEEWMVNFIQEKREAKELQEREERMAYAACQPGVMYVGQDSAGMLMKIYELLKELVSRVSRFIPSPKPTKTFRMLLQGDDKEDILRRLHASIDGKSGKAVAMVLLRALKDKMICKLPNEPEFCTEFKLLGSWKAISNNFRQNANVDISSVVI